LLCGFSHGTCAHHGVQCIEVGLASIHFTHEWIHMWNICLPNFICIPPCLDILYNELSSPKFHVYHHIWILYLSPNDQCAYSQFCIHVFLTTFSQWLYIISIHFVYDCSTTLSIFSMITFCMTCHFFHDSTSATFVNLVLQ
jgi:hypothetical protein